MVGIDLFAGAGGLTSGAIQAGIKVFSCVEANDVAIETYSRNHPNVKVTHARIQEIKKLEWPRTAEATILFGGPPCQGFSTSNQRTRSRENPVNWLFIEFLRLVKSASPDIIVLENVKGLLDTDNGYFLAEICSRISSLGYDVATWQLSAEMYGIPQRRTRLFVIGCRNVRVPPPPSICKGKVRTVADAIADLPELPNGANIDLMPYRRKANNSYAIPLRDGQKTCTGHLVTRNAPIIIERFSHVPQGGNWADIPAYLMRNYKDRNRCHTGIYHRLDADAPAKVVGNYRKNMLIHPYEDRGLSVREAARLQSFADSFEFCGSIGFQQQQVGNAVPPLLAKAVFEVLLDL